MTGAMSKTSEFKQERIRKLTEEGEDVAVIAERLGIAANRVYYFQIKMGLREPKKRGEKRFRADRAVDRLWQGAVEKASDE